MSQFPHGEDDVDLLFARQLQAEESKCVNSIFTNQLKEDEELARKLQSEFEQEYNRESEEFKDDEEFAKYLQDEENRKGNDSNNSSNPHNTIQNHILEVHPSKSADLDTFPSLHSLFLLFNEQVCTKS